MKVTSAVFTILGCLALLPWTAANAAGSHGTPASRPNTAVTVFHLQVAGNAGHNTTFWVAYGPLAGKFGIVRLRETRTGVYEAARTLPTGERADFTYLAATGVVRTPHGTAPGSPITTIKTVGPLSVWPHGVPAVRWQPPVG